jgi:hypothetical protein
MRPRTLALLVCLAAATALLAAPAVPATSTPDGGDVTATTTTPTTANGRQPTAETSPPGRTTDEDPAVGEFTRTASLQDNVLRFFAFPGAVLGLCVGVAHSLGCVIVSGRRVVRQLLRKLVGAGGVGMLLIAVVAMAGQPPVGRIALGGLGASCAVVALANGHGATLASKAGAAASAAGLALLLAVGAAAAGVTSQLPPPVVVAAPGVGAAGLFVAGIVAARRGALSAVAASVGCYWIGAVAAGMLSVEAVGLGGGLLTMFVIACCALGPLVGTPLYVLGLTTPGTRWIQNTPPNRD